MLIAETVTATLERLGPAYVKVGQVLSSRVDLLPPAACGVLSRLYDRVQLPDPAAARRAVPAVVAAEIDGGADGAELVAAGSIAYVYRARLRDSTMVAVKVRRPGIIRTMTLDLALIGIMARHAGRLPGLRGAPVADIVAQVSESIEEQLDFAREARSLTLLRTNLAELPGVKVPAVVDGLSGPAVLVTEWIDGLRQGAGTASTRRAAVLSGLRAAYRMLFRDGFVHCDLHPGNLYLMDDGTAVLVDAGFTRRLDDLTRRRFAEFFYYMGRNEGARCAEVLLSTVLDRRGSADRDGFRADVTALIARTSGAAAGEFNLVRFAFDLFAIQRAHGFHADPQFVFPILALVVLEGTVRDAAPDIDFQGVAMPYVLGGLSDTAGVATTGPAGHGHKRLIRHPAVARDARR